MRRRWTLGAIAVLALAVAVAVLRGGGGGAGLDAEGLREDPLAPSTVPAGFDVTIVVFSDYACPHCRKLDRALRAVAAVDGRIRVVYRDWPVFGDASVEAARLAIASQRQGAHGAFHAALMRLDGSLDEQGLRRAAAAAGVDWQRLQADATAHRGEIDALLARTAAYAAAFGFHGTPGLVVGRYVIAGGLGAADLRKAVAMVRDEQR